MWSSLAGSSGTLDELAIAYDEGKLIGVLTGTGGISDIAEQILAACGMQTGAHVIYHADPRELISRLLSVYQQHHFRHPSVFCRASVTAHADAANTAEDPVCGIKIRPETAAAKRTRRGVHLYFCSLQCAARFDDIPVLD